ncbi:MAG: DUF6465 family protein [Pseudobutyrivibrio sp.]|nr:DUF6465 family protein [Pseudobutyrivibrio sp.]
MVTNARVTVEDVKKTAASAASTVKAAAASANEVTKKVVAEVKKEATAVKKTATKKATAAKKTATKKATAAKTTVKKATTKAKSKKAITSTTVIQYQGLEFTEAECLKKVKAAFKKDYKGKVLEEVNIYIKPEEHKIYYVANKDCIGSVDI